MAWVGTEGGRTRSLVGNAWQSMFERLCHLLYQGLRYYDRQFEISGAGVRDLCGALRRSDLTGPETQSILALWGSCGIHDDNDFRCEKKI